MYSLRFIFLSVLCTGCALHRTEAPSVLPRPTRETGLAENLPVKDECEWLSFTPELSALGPNGEVQTKLLSSVSLKVPMGWHVARKPFPLSYHADNHWQNYYLLNRTGKFNDLDTFIIVHPRANPDFFAPYSSTEKLVAYRSLIFDHYPGNQKVSTKLDRVLESNGNIFPVYRRSGGYYLPGWFKLVTGKVLDPHSAIGFCLASRSRAGIDRSLTSFEDLVKSLQFEP